MTPTCKQCGHRHYNYVKCAGARAVRQRDIQNITPEIHKEGWRPFSNRLENVKLHGGQQVIKSGLTREGWKEVGC